MFNFSHLYPIVFNNPVELNKKISNYMLLLFLHSFLFLFNRFAYLVILLNIDTKKETKR